MAINTVSSFKFLIFFLFCCTLLILILYRKERPNLFPIYEENSYVLVSYISDDAASFLFVHLKQTIDTAAEVINFSYKTCNLQVIHYSHL